MDNAQQFREIVKDSISRIGIDSLMEWLDNSDFFTAPASTRFHGSYSGGLCEHSLNVYRRLVELNEFYHGDYTPETLALVALFHDVCKVGMYKTEMRWRKDQYGRWEQYPTYKASEDFHFGGHGSKSTYLVMYFVQLEPQEAAAINSHMGPWDRQDYGRPGDVYEDNMLAWMLHVADEAATYIDKT